MKPLDEKKVWAKEILARDHRLAVVMMIRQQIDVVQGLMERHQELVEQPLHYNMCAGLLDQLQAHSFAAFNEGSAAVPAIPDGVPTSYFKFPDSKEGW